MSWNSLWKARRVRHITLSLSLSTAARNAFLFIADAIDHAERIRNAIAKQSSYKIRLSQALMEVEKHARRVLKAEGTALYQMLSSSGEYQWIAVPSKFYKPRIREIFHSF
jgi:thiamine monophosphate kinase